ncbi:N/A [soil metagenome]
MPLPRALDQLEHQWGMRCAGALLDLPSTGATVLRWTRTTVDPFEFSIVSPPDLLLLTMVLQPMRACSHVDDREVWAGPIRGGSIRLIQPRADKQVGFSSSSPFDLLHIHFPLSGLKTAARRFGIEFNGFQEYGGPLYRPDDIGQLLGTQFVGALSHAGSAGRMYADGIAQSLVAHLLRNYEQVTSRAQRTVADHEGLQAAFAHVEQHPHETLGVARLARIAGMSEFHFARQFKQRYGVTPHAHLIASRLRLAKTDLAFSDRNILQIAMDCGFSDSSHFARLFRKAEGVTPLGYRQAQQQRA